MSLVLQPRPAYLTPTASVKASELAFDLHAAYGLMLCVPPAGFQDLISGVSPTTLTAEVAPLQTINGYTGYRPVDTNTASVWQIQFPVVIPCNTEGATLFLQITGLLYGNHTRVIECGTGGARGVGAAFDGVTGGGSGLASIVSRITSYGVAGYAYSGTGPKPSDGIVNLVYVYRKNGTSKWWANGIEIGSVATGTFNVWNSSDSFRIGLPQSSASNNFRGIHLIDGVMGAPIDDTLAQILSNDLSVFIEEFSEPGFYSSGSSDVSISLSGISSSFSRGSLIPTTTITLSGNSSLFTKGDLTPALAKTLTGQSATFSGGTLTPVTGITVNLTGQSFTGSVGSLKAALAVNLLGQSVTASGGTITPSVGGNVSVNLSGISGTFSYGTLTAGQGLPPETMEFSWSNKKAKFSFKARYMNFDLD